MKHRYEIKVIMSDKSSYSFTYGSGLKTKELILIELMKLPFLLVSASFGGEQSMYINPTQISTLYIKKLD